MSSILTEYPLFWAIPCLLLGVGYAALLYTRQAPWGPTANRLLALLRAVLVALVALLLLGPYAKQLRRTAEKPVIALALDHSESMALVNSPERLQQAADGFRKLGNALADAGIEPAWYGFGGEMPSDSLFGMGFRAGASNLSALLQQVQRDYENRNLAGVVLLSDGIYNEGMAPSYLPSRVPVFPLALGDTVPQRDVSLRALYANKIAYLGNRFPLMAEVHHEGFGGREVLASLMHQNKVLDQKRLQLPAQGLAKVEFLAEAAEAGTQRYTVQLQPLEGEFTRQNNAKSAYVEVIDSREKILLVAAAPHPDIKAIRAALAQRENYQFEVYIPGIDEAVNLNDRYDVVIFHQIPHLKRVGNDLPAQFAAKGSAIWYILGRQSLLPAFNQLQSGVSVRAQGTQQDLVTPIFNTRFGRFTFGNDQVAMLTKMPPSAVPFGDYELASDVEVLLQQRVGSVPTEKPLLAVRTSEGKKTAVMLGEGLWQWRLQEYARSQKHQAFDDLVGKLVQYLSTKEDKRRFRVYPAEQELLNTDRVAFETEVYNDIYEQIYGQQVSLSVWDERREEQSFAYTHAGPGSQYVVRGLKAGVYRYKATTTLDGQPVSVEGQFSIREQELEALQTTADFGMLRLLARETGGAFFMASEAEALQERLLRQPPPEIIHTQETTDLLLHEWWPLLLLALLAAVEWLVRKLKGGY
jgi:hypothetical protein